MKVLGIDFIVSNVTDIEKAKAFYTETLGIDAPFVEGKGWVEFDTHPVAFALGVPPPNWAKPPVTALALAVEDVHAAVNELREKGVEVLVEPMETSVCTMAYIADPDGNPIFLHRRHDGSVG